MEKNLIFTVNEKRYQLRSYNGSPIIIFQVENTITGEWKKKNIYIKSDPEVFYKLQKTQIKSAYSPYAFIEKLQHYIDTDFCICIVVKILRHMETMKEATI